MTEGTEKQGTAEWFSAKIGNLGASPIFDLIPGKRGGYLAARENLFWDIMAERITGAIIPKFVSASMQWGIDMEPYARLKYMSVKSVQVTEVGFIRHPRIPRMGASPDGMVGEDGLVEIKCPITTHALQIWSGEEIDPRWVYQMQAQMACTGRAWCDFCMFDPRLPAPLDLFIKRIPRDRLVIELIETEARKFLDELAEKEDAIRAQMRRLSS